MRFLNTSVTKKVVSHKMLVGFGFTITGMALLLVEGCALVQQTSPNPVPAETAPPQPPVVNSSIAPQEPAKPPVPPKVSPKEKSGPEAKLPQTGEASWYGPKFHGKTTASGETFNQEALSAAHASLPLGSKVKVTNLNNGKSVEVEINDRGPFAENRIIDLSRAAARALDMKEDGTAIVRIEPLSPQPQ